MNELFQKSLKDSLYVHYPLKPEQDRSIEKKNLDKEIKHSVSLWDGESLEPWSFEGDGEAKVEEKGVLHLLTWSRADHWPDSEVRAHDAAAGEYATFGSLIAKLDVRGLDLSVGNRIYFKIKPECEGNRSPIVRVGFINNGTIKIPDAYSREGFNAMNLENHQWNECVWEIDSIAHDKLEEISFNIHRYGKDVSTGDNMVFELKDVRFEEVEPNVVHGWQCKKEGIAYSTTGYFADGGKTAVVNTAAKTFEIVRASDETKVYEGSVTSVKTYTGEFQMIDFSDLKEEGEYKIRFGNTVTESFAIGMDILVPSLWKLINFLYCERCGYPVPDCHGTCHHDVYAEHNGLKKIFSGGWHDAADVSQQTMQTAEILDGVLAAAKEAKKLDETLYLRMMEEANWGLDFVLRMRFGDGYRASHAALRRWTDGLIGNMDDVQADVNNRSFENFVFAAVEAGAAEAFRDMDPELSWKCLDAAKEDFLFARERFEKVGLEAPHMVEHTAGASLSQYYAAAAWAASRLYEETKESRFADYAGEYADKITACQEAGNEPPLNGYFYRDETKKHIVHFSHQARDHVFVMALSSVCKALEKDERRADWEQAMKLHGEYLKKLSEYTKPYGMLPAGIYHISEAEDRETFEVIHPHAEFEVDRKNYIEQLENGISLENGYYIKIFPVWFSYRGNSAIQLSMGKAASLLGQYFKDEELIQIGREQLYWTLGKNPFSQSLMYGEGDNYGQEYTALLGETVGEMPVGVQTRRNEDLPYWPQANIATYREVWTTPPGRFLWIAADVMQHF